ncbi:MAG: deoxyribodipyrimidine photolyase [Vicinamibacterales bacterium]
MVPSVRVRACNDAPVRQERAYVLYWMTTQRRAAWNPPLDAAVAWALRLDRPLVVLETLACDEPWASDRFHRFIVEGMRDNREAFAGSPVQYYPYVGQAPGDTDALLLALATEACVVVTDDYPTRVVSEAIAAVAGRLDVTLEAIDGNGLLPMRATTQVYPSAHAFRRHFQKTIHEHLPHGPSARPLRRLTGALPALPLAITRQWPIADLEHLATADDALAALPIDHGVRPVATRGGTQAARACLTRFLESGLPRYSEDRSHPDREGTSRLSPYLHTGHLGVHEIFTTAMRRAGWLGVLPARATGSKAGWWGVAPELEAFLDELLVWRELGFNMCALRPDYAEYASLPAWARATLAAHGDDPRPFRYSLEEFETARTHDRVWNAAQRELVRDGRLHNYMRMLWGKKILEWTDTPESALTVMIQLNNKYALDGRDPNSYSGIFWVLGRYDRPWPERPVFGTIRCMTSDSAVRKLDLDAYLRRYGPDSLFG